MKFGTRNRGPAALAAVGLAALVLSGCTGADAPAPGPADATLTIGSQVDITSFDPAQAHVGHYMPFYQAVYDTLILQEPDGELVPMLATEWSYDDDRTVLTLDLRDDVTFSDGAVFDAAAVKANLDRFPTVNGRQAAMLASVESVDVVDDDTVAINLTAPDPALEFYLSQAAGFMASPEALDGEGLATVPVGSGPYVLDETASAVGVSYTFVPREDYWNPDLQKFVSIEFAILTDDTARTNALATGEIAAAAIPTTSVAQAEGSGVTVELPAVDWEGILLMDRDGALTPALSDVRVRQAINFALDRDALLAAGGGFGVATSQPFGIESTAFDESLEDFYAYDLDAAKDLMAAAGYADGFAMTVPSLGAAQDPAWALIGDQLGEIGITLTLEPVAFPDFIPGVAQKKWSAVLWRLFQSETWVNVGQFALPRSLYNPFGTTDPEIERLLDELRAADATDVAAAQALNTYLVENAWFAPLYRVQGPFAFDSDLLEVEQQAGSVVPAIYNYAPAS